MGPRLLTWLRSTAGERAAAALGFLACAVAWTWPLVLRPGTSMAAPFGDPLLNAWILGWDADRLRHGFAGLWDAPPFYPYPDTLAYSEHLLGVAIPLAPLHWLTGNAVLVHNVALVLSFALAGAGMYLLARDLTGRRDAAVLAALAFLWCPYRAPHVTHLQVLLNGWMPVALWALHHAFATGRWRAWVGFAVAFVLLGLSNGYFLFFFAVPVAIVAIVELVRQRARLAAPAIGLAVSGAIVLAAVAPVAATYLRVKHEQGLSRTRGDAVQFGATPSDYVRVSHQPRLWSKVLSNGGPEKELFPGLTVVVLALCALLPWSRTGGTPPPLLPTSAGVPLYLTIALVAFALSMGPEPALFGRRWATGPYDWLGAIVPGFEGLRVPARFASVVYVALAVLAAYGAARVLAWIRPIAARLAIVVLLGAVTIAEGYIGPLPLERVPSADMAVDRAAYEWLRTQPRAAMLELPMGDPDPAVRYQFRTLLHGNRIVNGYSGYGSALQDFLRGPPSSEIARVEELLATCRALGLGYVVVHGQRYGDPRIARQVTEDIRAQAGHVERWRAFGPVTVFELRAPTVSGVPRPAGTEIPQATFRLSASHNAGALGAVIDGDPATRWLSGIPQDGSEWIQVELDRVRRPAFVRLAMDRRSFGDYPRRLEIAGSIDGRTFTPVFAGGVVQPFALSLVELPVVPRIDLALPPRDARFLRLRQTGGTPRRWYWSVHEIRLWE